jgi:hypothetical protein
MLQYNTLAAAMTEIENDQVTAGYAAAKDIIGDKAWKSGWTADRQKITRDCLQKAGAQVVEAVEGVITSVGQATTNGGKFRKVRVELKDARLMICNGTREPDIGPQLDKPVILTLEIDGEFTQRLLSKLTAATPGARARIGGFASMSPPRDGGAVYANHACTLKENGTEIRSAGNHIGEAAALAKEAAKKLQEMGMDDRESISNGKSRAKANYFWKLAEIAGARFKTVGAKPAEQESAPVAAGDVQGFNDDPPW